jgi:transcriptional regulator with PAS, ATPase and Fis domain
VRLLRVLENGEFIKVVLLHRFKKTDIVAATNVNLFDAIEKENRGFILSFEYCGYYFTSFAGSKEDIHLLFRNLLLILRINIKCPLKLDENAIELLKFRWSGNIRQLRNVAEQISVLETNRDITTTTTILLTRARQQPSVSHY